MLSCASSDTLMCNDGEHVETKSNKNLSSKCWEIDEIFNFVPTSVSPCLCGHWGFHFFTRLCACMYNYSIRVPACVWAPSVVGP